MTKEEYKQHLCDIICMVFRAEDEINKAEPELRVKQNQSRYLQINTWKRLQMRYWYTRLKTL